MSSRLIRVSKRRHRLTDICMRTRHQNGFPPGFSRCVGLDAYLRRVSNSQRILFEAGQSRGLRGGHRLSNLEILDGAAATQVEEVGASAAVSGAAPLTLSDVGEALFNTDSLSQLLSTLAWRPVFEVDAAGARLPQR